MSNVEQLFTLRPATAADYAWLWELKRVTMRPYVEQTWGTWNDQAQEQFFRRSYSSETVQIILVDGRKAGLLHVEREPAEIFLANIQIHPTFQHAGIGTAAIRTVLQGAAALRMSVRLQVLKVNTDAQRLYARLGFAPASESATHVILRWRPA